MRNAQKLSVIATLVVTAISPFSAYADTANANFAVTATVLNKCTMSIPNLTFGNYDPTSGTALQGQTPITLKCTPTVSGVSIDINNGSNFSAGTRRMVNGTDFLNYDLYKPSATTSGAACAYTAKWGTGAGGTAFAPSGTFNPGAGTTYNICGQIPITQAVPAGVYTDTIVTATVTFS